MKIGFVIGALARGGAELQFMALARGLVERGHDVSAIAYDGASPFDDDLRAAGVLLETGAARSRLEKLRLVRRWMRSSRMDVVHGIMNLASSLTLLARLPARRPAVVASDYSSATYFRNSPMLRAALLSFALADAIVTESEVNRANLIPIVPRSKHKVAVIRNGLETGRFDASPRSARAPDEPFRFCVVGTVYAVKNPRRVVEAVSELVRRGHRSFRVDWYGRLGIPPSEEEGRLARAYAASMGVSSYIAFHGAVDDVERVYPASDALLHASVAEGFPNAVSEGMACGLPIVVSHVSDLPWVVETARNGFAFDALDVGSIADAMERMLQTPEEERLAMGRRSHAFAREQFSMERFVTDHEALYQRCIAGHDGRNRA